VGRRPLSKADTIFLIPIPGLDFFPFNLFFTPEGLPLNPLPLLYIASAIWQTHITPMSPGMDPTQQKLMRWMPLILPRVPLQLLVRPRALHDRQQPVDHLPDLV
jgi:membrane protein insertase Oxa1/YidC/SpoIIIJ